MYRQILGFLLYLCTGIEHRYTYIQTHNIHIYTRKRNYCHAGFPQCLGLKSRWFEAPRCQRGGLERQGLFQCSHKGQGKEVHFRHFRSLQSERLKSVAGQVRNVVSEIVGMDNLVDAAYPEGQIVLNNPSQRSTVAFSVFGSSRSAKIYAPVVSGSRAHTQTHLLHHLQMWQILRTPPWCKQGSRASLLPCAQWWNPWQTLSSESFGSIKKLGFSRRFLHIDACSRWNKRSSMKSVWQAWGRLRCKLLQFKAHRASFALDRNSTYYAAVPSGLVAFVHALALRFWYLWVEVLLRNALTKEIPGPSEGPDWSSAPSKCTARQTVCGATYFRVGFHHPGSTQLPKNALRWSTFCGIVCSVEKLAPCPASNHKLSAAVTEVGARQ